MVGRQQQPVQKLISFRLQNPVKSLRKYAFLALFVVYVLYMFANVAFFAAGKCTWMIKCHLVGFE